jgi:hypothetical protein
VLAVAGERVGVGPVEVPEREAGGALVAASAGVVQGAVRPEAADNQGHPSGYTGQAR